MKRSFVYYDGVKQRCWCGWFLSKNLRTNERHDKTCKFVQVARDGIEKIFKQSFAELHPAKKETQTP